MGWLFFIVAFCLMIGLVIWIFVGLLRALVVGIRAFDRNGWNYRPYVITRRLLALNLCEPLANAVLITTLAFAGVHWSNTNALQITFPMAVLLIPALGLCFGEPFYRKTSAHILLLGLMRWALNVLIFSLIIGGQSELTVVWVGLAIAAGAALLWHSTSWAEAQLNGPLAAPYYTPSMLQQLGGSSPAAQPAIASIASRLAATATPIFVPAPPLDLARAIRCALCQAPTAPDAEECPYCGLVFLSRVPPALQSLQRYAVLRPLGSGGMSSVYLARRCADGLLCVLKTLASVDGQPAATWQAEASSCLRREAALLVQLDHPRVARALDWFGDERGDFLVLEYIAGPTLEQRLTRTNAQGSLIRGAALPPGAALAYGASVAETLCYLADLPRPVVHCDIKPANLIVPPDAREPLLVDFGGAVCVALGSQATTRLDRYGTPGYAAPEQYAGASSPKSDVYGLAATLYHLLTDDDPNAHPLAFTALAALPPELAAVLAPALDRDPGARPDAAQFGAELRDLLSTISHL